jgi:BirA family transcriptional regulator, biotin operon repressor / biotin---[acetyl-CoA-carboxylase] ligase
VLTADSLAPARVEPLLTGRFGRPYLYEDTVESTQSLLAPDMPEGAAAVADEQTGGRGRQGRSWDAPPGTALLFSVLLKPPGERNLPELSLVGGLATAEAVERATGLAAQIKWPNDVMLNRRKVAGVIAEASEGSVVLGIGLNVNQRREDLPQDARVAAGSLYTIDGVPRERAGVLADLIAALERNYDEWLQGGLDALYDGLGARDFLRGRKVELDGRTGIGVGIDRQGRFELDLDGGRWTIESGELLFER